jgi:hypothetical protein
MTIAALASIVSSCLGFVVAALGFGFSSAPGWKDQRLPAFSALMLGFYSATNCVFTLEGIPTRVLVL